MGLIELLAGVFIVGVPALVLADALEARSRGKRG
jgi:hypothetical protein